MDSEDPSQQVLFIAEVVAASPAIIGYVLQGLLIAFLLFMSALISGSEVAFFSITHDEIRQCVLSERKSENLVAKLLERPKKLLATILIFNNLVNVAIVTLSTYITWEVFPEESQSGLLVAIITIVITFLIVFFGEILPKVFANQRSVSFARKTAGMLNLVGSVFKPLSWLLMSFTGLLERRVKKQGYAVSVDELHHAVEMTTKGTTDEEKDILRGIVNFSSITVKQVMKSRMDILAFDYDMNFHHLMDKINKSNFSRIPVFKERIDSIEGILYVKDILPFISQDENFSWQKLLRKGFFVPESKKIDDLLRDFQSKRVHMAIVVDEYGGTSGLITMEDVIEEIIGDINDEFDTEDVVYTKIDQHTFIFEGKTSLNDFSKILELKQDAFDKVKGESESLGGLLLEINSSMPQVGEKISYKRFDFIIESVNAKRIKRVKVIVNKKLAKQDEIPQN